LFYIAQHHRQKPVVRKCALMYLNKKIDLSYKRTIFYIYHHLISNISVDYQSCYWKQCKSDTARLMLANSEFLMLFSQTSTGQQELSKLLHISDDETDLITDAAPGHGLLRMGGTLVPFYNTIPQDTELYKQADEHIAPYEINVRTNQDDFFAKVHALRHMSSTVCVASQPSNSFALDASAQKAGKSPSLRGPMT